MLPGALQTGVILGVSLLHLFAEANEFIMSQMEYPLGLALLILGILLALGATSAGLLSLDLIYKMTNFAFQ